jgi:hypothetical protein
MVRKNRLTYNLPRPEGRGYQVEGLVPPLCGGMHISTLRVDGRGAADLSVPTQSVGTRIPGEACLAPTISTALSGSP